jgi:hypothetical protein
MKKVRFDEVASQLAEAMPELLFTLLGEPSFRGRQAWPFRTRGSLSVEVAGPKRGVWYDYEAGRGGDALALVAHVRREDIPRRTNGRRGGSDQSATTLRRFLLRDHNRARRFPARRSARGKTQRNSPERSGTRQSRHSARRWRPTLHRAACSSGPALRCVSTQHARAAHSDCPRWWLSCRMLSAAHPAACIVPSSHRMGAPGRRWARRR